MPKEIKLEDFQITLQKKTFPGGLKFVHFFKPNAPISIQICSRSGSRFDSQDKQGLAHFLEHSVLDGTEKYADKKELSLLFDDVGGSYSAKVGKEGTCFDFMIAKKTDLKLVAEVVDQILNKPLLNQKIVDLEKKVIKTEISSKMDNSGRVLSNNQERLIFGDNSLSRNISGTEESIGGIDRQDLLNQLKNILPQDMTVVSCGSCEITDLINALKPILPHKKFSSKIEPPILQIKTKTGATKWKEKKLVHCALAFPIPGVGSKDEAALNILSSYLGRGRTSLLTDILRYKNGLLYSITSGNQRLFDTGYLYIEMDVKKENLQEVLNKITSALSKLVKNGIPQKTLSIIKNKVVNHGIIATQTVQFWTNSHHYRELLIRDNDYYYTDFLNDINAISKKAVDQTIKKYLPLKNMFFYAVGDIDETEAKQFFETSIKQA